MKNKSLELLSETIEKSIGTTQRVYDKAYKIDPQYAEYYKGYMEGLKWANNLIKIALCI